MGHRKGCCRCACIAATASCWLCRPPSLTYCSWHSEAERYLAIKRPAVASSALSAQRSPVVASIWVIKRVAAVAHVHAIQLSRQLSLHHLAFCAEHLAPYGAVVSCKQQYELFGSTLEVWREGSAAWCASGSASFYCLVSDHVCIPPGYQNRRLPTAARASSIDPKTTIC